MDPLDALPQVETIASMSRRRRHALIERAAPDAADVEASVRDIIEAVREQGDEALLSYTERFDGVHPDPLLLGPDVFEAAWDALPAELASAIEHAAENLEKVAVQTTPPARTQVDVEPGLVVTEIVRPLSRVGCYVPGGKAAYPSSVLMAAIPARAAGVRDIVVASPPGKDGRPPLEVLAACHIAGVTSVLVAGGAQAIAALAYGTATLKPVDKIVGPGNRFVTAAKRQVFGVVDIDAPAGPTEVLILADESADPRWVALDLVAQAEHAEDSRCLLVTPSEALADAVRAALPAALDGQARRDVAMQALAAEGALLVARDQAEACAFAKAYAPEHLQIMTQGPEAWAAAVPSAAAVFLGPYAPVPVGDYLTGANHVLPTGGAARWAAPLSVHSFLTRQTRQRLSADAANAVVDDLGILARAEGLVGHAIAFEARRERPRPFHGGEEADGAHGGAAHADVPDEGGARTDERADG